MIVWTFAVGGKHTRASHVCTLSVRVRLFGFSIQMTTKELERQNGFERDREERTGTTFVVVSLLEGRKNVGLCSFSVPPTRSFVVRRRRAVSPRRLPSLRLRGARAALELEAIDSALTHSLPLLPSHLSLPPSITLFPSLLILRRSLGGLSFLASFPARGQVRYQDYVKGRPCPLSLSHLGAYYIIYNGPTPLHSTPLARTPSPSLSSTFSDLSLSLSLSPAAAKRFAAGRFKWSRSQL